VDDGSQDSTLAVLKNITDARFKYRSQLNKGASAARNASYKLSTGVFIKFMDADDLLNEACIENQLLKIIEKPDCIASATWGRFYNEDLSDFTLSYEKVWKDLPGIDWLINSLIDTGANMMQPGIFLLPRNIVEKAGPWNESLSLIDDFDFMTRVISASKMVLFCEEAVLMYRSGIINNLSSKVSYKHMESAYHSLRLGVDTILKVRNDTDSRLACANTYKRWSFEFYPNYLPLLNKLENEIGKLGGSNINMLGGKWFNFLSKLIGWKMAKKIKIFLFGKL
jgi:glycosyltransferase involved in cell wall biosynthesis